jgi:3-oxoacyl-[acyl-carrier protein] reductase
MTFASGLGGKTALVTGSSGAIGQAIVARLRSDGARIVAVDLSPLPSSSYDGADVVPMVADLSQPDGIESLLDRITRLVGRIDILVNNAGVLSNAKLAATTIEEWRRVHTINLDAAFLLARALLPSMRAEKWGRVINMASFAAKSGGLTAGTAYSVSKAALIGLTFSIARETAADGVTVNAIAPAYVLSPMVTEQLTSEQRARQLSQIPVGRFCEPEEVAHSVSYLASPLAGFITGEVIDMNGGLQFD